MTTVGCEPNAPWFAPASGWPLKWASVPRREKAASPQVTRQGEAALIRGRDTPNTTSVRCAPGHDLGLDDVRRCVVKVRA